METDSLPENANNDCEDDGEEVQIQGQNAQRSESYYLELGILFLFIGNNLVSTLLQNQIIKQSCIEMGFNQTICDVINENRDEDKEIEEKIQPYVANINLVITLIHTIFPAMISLFLGNWSDLYGRKKILCSTFLGYSITITSFSVVCYYSEYIHSLSPWYYVACYAPAAISGGWTSLLTASLCYITDTCDATIRSKRLTIIELIIFLGVLLGIFFCSSLLALTDAPTVFIIASTFAIFGFFIVIFLVRESIIITDDVSTLQKVKDLLSPIIIVNLLKSCFKRRSFNDRRILLLLISIMSLLVFCFNGNSTVSYLFVREKFSWTLQQNNFYESYSIVSSLVGSVIGIGVLKKLLKISDMKIASIAIICGIIESFLKAFAYKPWHMYAITSITLFRILSSPMLRTMISTIVPHDEIGKIFSITTSFEALSTLGATPLYTIIYKSTFTTFAGAFYLISTAVMVINLLISFYIIYLKRIRDTISYRQI